MALATLEETPLVHAYADPALVPHARTERLPDASHWVHADRPERVNALLLDFLADLRHSRATLHNTP